MSALVELHNGAMLFDNHGGRAVQEVSEDLLRLGPLVFTPYAVGHEPIKGAGHEGDLEIEVDLEAYHGRERVEVEELNSFGDSVLNEHSLGVTSDQVWAAGLEVVGKQDCGLFVPEISDGDLAQFAAVLLEPYTLVEDLGSPESAGQRAQRDPAPGRDRTTPDLAEHSFRPAPQGHEEDSSPVQFLQMLIRRQLGVEDQLGGRSSGVLLPELHKPQDLARLLSLGNSGVGIAQDPFGGIARQENENAFLAPATAGVVVVFQRFLPGIGGDRMEIEIDGGATLDPGALCFVKPSRHQAQAGVVVDTRAIGCQIGPLGNDVQSRKERNPFVKDQIHDVTLAFLADELERQKGTQGLLGEDHTGPWEINPPEHFVKVNLLHQRNEEEQAANSSSEGSRRKVQLAHIGDGSSLGFDRSGPLVVATPRKSCEAFLS